MPATDGDNPGVHFPPPLIFLGCLLLGFLADRLLGLPFVMGRWPELAGWTLVVLGSVLIGAAMGWFFSAGTNPEPWKRDNALVTRGFYRITRNPMYLGMAFATLGAALLFGSIAGLAGAALAVLLVDRLVIPREERYLERVFGADYAAYRRRVRRWL